MRLPTWERDYWQLRSGEQAHRESPATFWIPPLEQRQALKPGQAAKLFFEVESADQNGVIIRQGERMWVIVAEKCGEFYIGILDNQPASVESSKKVYLCFGAEIPFLPEHIIDIADPPKEYSDWQLSQKPERIWSRD
jgi:hypothetical protein